MNRFKIVAIGDSVIEGKAAPGEHGWVCMFGEGLGLAPADLRVVNRGVGSNTAPGIRERLQVDCIAESPDLVVVGVGVNDSRFRPSRSDHETPIDRFTRDLGETLRRLRMALDVPVVVAGQVPVVDGLVDPYKPDKHYRRVYQLPYETVIARTARGAGCLYLENLARWSARGESFIQAHLADGLHPNAEGHLELAGYAREFLRIHLQEYLQSEARRGDGR